jgi:type I restriction enzyme, S subunit
VRLSDVCEITARQVDPRIAEYAALPHVNGENIETGTCRLTHVATARDARLISGKYLFEAGNVLYSKLRPYLRKVVVAAFPGVCSADMYPIRVRSDVLLPDYLAWRLLSPAFTAYAVEQSVRARMPKLNREQLLSWQMLLPPIEEQRRVSQDLAMGMVALQRARAAAEDQLEATREMAASNMRQTFFGPRVAAWPRRRLGEVGEIVSGVTLGRPTDADTRRVAYLRVANVKDGFLDLSSVYDIEATTPKLSACGCARVTCF